MSILGCGYTRMEYKPVVVKQYTEVQVTSWAEKCWTFFESNSLYPLSNGFVVVTHSLHSLHTCASDEVLVDVLEGEWRQFNIYPFGALASVSSSLSSTLASYPEWAWVWGYFYMWVKPTPDCSFNPTIKSVNKYVFVWWFSPTGRRGSDSSAYW